MAVGSTTRDEVVHKEEQEEVGTIMIGMNNSSSNLIIGENRMTEGIILKKGIIPVRMMVAAIIEVGYLLRSSSRISVILPPIRKVNEEETILTM